jgi:hypothetical protein
MLSVSGDSKNFTLGLPSFFGPKASIVTLSDGQSGENQSKTNELSGKVQAIFVVPGKRREKQQQNVDNNNKYGRIVWILSTVLTITRM